MKSMGMFSPACARRWKRVSASLAAPGRGVVDAQRGGSPATCCHLYHDAVPENRRRTKTMKMSWVKKSTRSTVATLMLPGAAPTMRMQTWVPMKFSKTQLQERAGTRPTSRARGAQCPPDSRQA